jgi:hypothetical protein
MADGATFAPSFDAPRDARPRGTVSGGRGFQLAYEEDESVLTYLGRKLPSQRAALSHCARGAGQ